MAKPKGAAGNEEVQTEQTERVVPVTEGASPVQPAPEPDALAELIAATTELCDAASRRLGSSDPNIERARSALGKGV